MHNSPKHNATRNLAQAKASADASTSLQLKSVGTCASKAPLAVLGFKEFWTYEQKISLKKLWLTTGQIWPFFKGFVDNNVDTGPKTSTAACHLPHWVHIAHSFLFRVVADPGSCCCCLPLPALPLIITAGRH